MISLMILYIVVIILLSSFVIYADMDEDLKVSYGVLVILFTLIITIIQIL